jgi:integrase
MGGRSVSPEPLLTARQVADVLGLSPATVLDRFQRGELPGFRVGGHVGDPVRFRWSELVARYLAQHEAQDVTLARLRSQLRQAEIVFGERDIRTLRPDELAAWRKGLSDGARHNNFRALKQVLEQATRWKWITENPARAVKNPRPKSAEIEPFESWEEIDAVCAELAPRDAALVVFLVGTGMRPEEALGLERRDIDRAAMVATVERVYTQGTLKPCAKSSRQRRRVPLRARVLDVLDSLPPRLDTPILFPGARGGHLELNKWRDRVWKPALQAAGIEHRRIYDCRHTFATWALAAGVSVFTLSRRMGTSLAMIDATYGHLAGDAEEVERALLDAWDATGEGVSRDTVTQ